ncbi:DUF3021 domain-containing protein [Clostridium sp. YIM B02551]|uniref:DUF3021 domain-containing protein n=1 Tax=Clostridium sp. YIM B02551 TaxID=2910679 RepID=UPI001EEB18FD|nr:DUF3021 domain-containing protein [Clostridium sp. YIM B02551]
MNLKDVIRRGLKGIVIGVFLIQTIGVLMMLFSKESATFSKEFLINQYVAASIIGFTFGALNILYQSEKLGLIGATILHFIGVSLVYIPCAIMAGWLINDSGVIISTITIFIATYFIVWLICYLQWKKYIKQINMELNIRRKE